MMNYIIKLKDYQISGDKSWSDSKNLIYFNDNQVLVWQTCDQLLSSYGLKDETNVTNIQSLILTTTPLFDVESLHLNSTGRYLAVVGPRGVHIIELPAKWGLNGAYEGGKDSILCRSWALGQRFFVCNRDIELLCSGWHPNCPQQQHIVILTNDNCLRIFDIREDEIPFQIINLSVGNPNASITRIGVSLYATSLGENAVSFDFGPSISKCYDIEPSSVTEADECLTPIYILRGNGDVLLVYSSLKYSYVSNTVFGPLTMRPPAEDNYGVDACSIACLDCVPPVLVIATSFGVLHHCIALECEDDLNTSRSLLPQPTLYVYETIELSLSLTTSTDIQDMTCALKLHKDNIIPMRYFCSHTCGVHAIAVPFISQLKSKEEFNFREEESVVEHLICTQPIATTDQSVVPLGVSVCVQNGYTFVLVLLSSGELISRRLTSSYITHVFDDDNSDGADSDLFSDVSLPKVDFIEYIKQLLKRNTSVPLLKSKSGETSENEWSQKLELFMSTTDLLETEYIKKFELTSNAIEKRVKVLTNDKQIQLKELNKCLTQKDSLLNDLLSLVDKYDETRERQEQLSDRIDKVLELLQFQRPELSEAELKLSEDLKRLSNKLTAHKNKLEQIKVKCKYQSQNKHQIVDSLSGDRFNTQIDTSRVQTTIPSPNQIKSIKEMLANQSEQIGQLVQSLNTFNTTNGFE